MSSVSRSRAGRSWRTARTLIVRTPCDGDECVGISAGARTGINHGRLRRARPRARPAARRRLNLQTVAIPPEPDVLVGTADEAMRSPFSGKRFVSFEFGAFRDPPISAGIQVARA
jgi:hypothetical protein